MAAKLPEREFPILLPNQKVTYLRDNLYPEPVEVVDVDEEYELVTILRRNGEEDHCRMFIFAEGEESRLIQQLKQTMDHAKWEISEIQKRLIKEKIRRSSW